MSTSTIVTIINGATTDTGTIIAAVVVSILALAVSLLGLGWGYRALKRHITGRKF